MTFAKIQWKCVFQITKTQTNGKKPTTPPPQLLKIFLLSFYPILQGMTILRLLQDISLVVMQIKLKSMSSLFSKQAY